MKDSDYPALYRCSDAASNSCQRWYMITVKSHLGLLAATGLIACWNPSSEGWEWSVSIGIALTMFLALLIGLVLKMGGLDDAWFRARAFAENTKNAAWRFMMTPQPSNQADIEREERAFLEELQKIRDRLPQVERYLSQHQDHGHEITEKMREVRALPTADRLAYFKKHRLQNQIAWYMRKAKMNAKSEHQWFFAIIAADGLAVIFAVVRLLVDVEYNPTGGIAALAACLLAWTQTKRFSDLANTYGVASRDLNGLATRADHVHTEDELRDFVKEVDIAVSREHRLWVEHGILTR
ncbi:MAG: SLATT domain-containing protein [Phycisphaerales bacterium]